MSRTGQPLPPEAGAGGQRVQPGGRRVVFVVVAAGYMAVTAAESLLAPLYPILVEEMEFDLREAGLAFGLLAAAIAIGNILGGLLLAKRGARQGALIALGATAAGAGLAAAGSGRVALVLSQVVLGLGSGAFFASGLSAAATVAGSRRRGLAIGFFGVAFSGGLAMAAVLAALAGSFGWRSAFAAASAFAVTSAVGIALVRISPREPAPPGASRPHWRDVMGSPLLVGGVAAASQYGTIAFLPAFAVTVWGLSPASAAIMLGVARVLSIPAKLASGRTADRTGALRVARRMALFLAALGVWWTIVPGPVAAMWAAVVFAAFVSGLGPVANLLAFEGFGDRGMLLGAFRSAQIGLGAATSAAIGGVSAVLGLRAALVMAVLLPLVLLPLGRRPARTPAGCG